MDRKGRKEGKRESSIERFSDDVEITEIHKR
jgi:hypothetical protein